MPNFVGGREIYAFIWSNIKKLIQYRFILHKKNLRVSMASNTLYRLPTIQSMLTTFEKRFDEVHVEEKYEQIFPDSVKENLKILHDFNLCDSDDENLTIDSIFQTNLCDLIPEKTMWIVFEFQINPGNFAYGTPPEYKVSVKVPSNYQFNILKVYEKYIRNTQSGIVTM